MSIPSVSILTITYLHQNDSLKLLLNMIKNQTYKNIKEWIILEGSMNDDDKVLINELVNSANFNIRYIKPPKDSNNSTLKNLLNDSATGDIMVCMNYDCYYFPTRIEHAVTQLLSNNEIDLAVCNNYYAHDFLLNRTIKYFSVFI
jgi:cellulose synthase/poly-beta-1,6-N-acetylglucosamine synthase-like glycosyltransferase